MVTIRPFIESRCFLYLSQHFDSFPEQRKHCGFVIVVVRRSSSSSFVVRRSSFVVRRSSFVVVVVRRRCVFMMTSQAFNPP